ncbi:MAG: M20 family metallopeptidase [Armatimonadota bacterium]
MLEEINDVAQALAPRLIELRRRIHRNPELAFQEQQTARLVADALSEAGIEPRTGVGKTGVVALVRGAGDGPTFAVRVDMDALPIQEETDLSFASAVPGVMHACGHDANTAMGLGAAIVLQRIRHRLKGDVKVIFQPAEEGAGGAQAMLADGVMNDPAVDAIIAAHVEPREECGRVILSYGAKLAAADVIEITIRGRGAHAAHPNESNDVIVAAAHAVLAIQAIPSRRVDPVEPVVVTIGMIQGGSAFNIIPEQVVLRGTVRTLSADLRDRMPALLEAALDAATRTTGATYELNVTRMCPPLVHDPELTALAEKACRDLLGDEAVRIEHKPSMGSEDYAFFAELAPATHLSIGSTTPGEPAPVAHSPEFDIDEECLPIGAAALAAVAARYLSG